MIVLIDKEFPWSDFSNSSPVLGVVNITYKFFNSRTLYLTEASIRLLINRPDILSRRVCRHDWKYIFQVDSVEVSNMDFDYLEIEETNRHDL